MDVQSQYDVIRRKNVAFTVITRPTVLKKKIDYKLFFPHFLKKKKKIFTKQNCKSASSTKFSQVISNFSFLFPL